MPQAELPRVYVIGTSVLMPDRSKPDGLIDDPARLERIIFEGGSTIGTLPTSRRFDESVLKRFPGFRDGNGW